ncbi:hypothetical protein EGP95_05955 [bacterium]|nr:hypothetical protein [bacterium]
MIESLACFKLNDANRKVLLYTYNEPYNGMNEYLKIYALELDDNNNIINGNMTEETHGQVKNAIAMMGKNQADSLEILPIPQIDLENVMGKAFAIPAIFKNGIKDTVNKKLQMVDNVSKDVITNTNNITNTFVNDDLSENVSNSEEKKSSESVEEGVNTNENSQTEKTDMFNSELIAPTSNMEINNPLNNNENEQAKSAVSLKNDISHDEEYNPMANYITNNTYDNNVISETDVNNTAVTNDKKSSDAIKEAPSISEVENALNVIIKYVENLKKDYKDVKTNSENTILNSLGNTANNALNLTNAEESKNEQLQMPQEFPSNNFTNESVFPDDELDVFDSEPKPEQEKNGYVAIQNIGQTPVNNGVFTENSSREKEEPVVMPDNFIGKQESKFEITGLGPSTLPADDSQIKNIA